MKKKILSILLTSILAVTVLAGCGNSADTSTEKSVTITNVSYDPTRELYSAYNELFAEHWKGQTGQDVEVIQSHGGSGKQALEVANGNEADVVTLALEYDVKAIQDAGLIEDGWINEFDKDSSPYTSTIVFLVRKGNPKNIQDWKDLIWAAAQASKGSRYEIAESSASYKAIGGGSIANLSTILFDASWNTYSSGSPISPLAPDFGFNMFIQGWRLYDTGYNYGATSGDPRFYAWIPLLGQYTSKKTSFWRIYISGHTKTDMTLNDGFDLGNGSGAAIRCVKNYK